MWPTYMVRSEGRNGDDFSLNAPGENPEPLRSLSVILKKGLQELPT